MPRDLPLVLRAQLCKKQRRVRVSIEACVRSKGGGGARLWKKTNNGVLTSVLGSVYVRTGRAEAVEDGIALARTGRYGPVEDGIALTNLFFIPRRREPF